MFEFSITICLVFLKYVNHANANAIYETPIHIAYPSSSGTYEFEMVIEKRLTMSRDLGDAGDGPVDYDPTTRSWTQRDSDPFTKCNHNSTILRNDDSTLLKMEVLATVIQHHGKHSRIVTINRKSPGEVIVVPLGAKVVLRVRNRLFNEAITVHIHGVDKCNAWFTDGVSFLQQCPIAPGSDYTYRFIADTPGTHWYHGHLMSDRADGLLGGFVVMRPEEKYTDRHGNPLAIGRQYYSILQDWNTETAASQWFCHTENTMKWVGYGFDNEHAVWADSTSRDGISSRSCWAPKRNFDGSNIGGSVPMAAIIVGSHGWYSQSDLRGRPAALPLTTYSIRKGENILLRLVNGGFSHGIMVSVEDHSILVVAADGENVVPKEVHALILFPGERYDVVICGMTQPLRPIYRIIFETLEYYNWDWTTMNAEVALADLRYEKVDTNKDFDENKTDFSHSNCTTDSKCEVLNCNFERFPPQYNFTCISVHLLESAEPIEDEELIAKKQFGNEYREIFANMNFDNHYDGWRFAVPKGMPYYHHDEGEDENADSFDRHSSLGPRMSTIAKSCDAVKCDRFAGEHWDDDCECFVHYKFKLGDIVQMTVYNMGDGGTVGQGFSHPLHIHGTHFYLMRIGYAQYHAENASIRAMNADIPCYDDTQRCVDLHWTNLTWMNGNLPEMRERPSFRDTVNIPTGGYVTIRFRATNPGWWFAHCHLLLHHMGGTAFAFRVGTHAQIPAPPSNFPHDCGVYEQSEPSSMNPNVATHFRPSLTASTLQIFLFSIFLSHNFVYIFSRFY